MAALITSSHQLLPDIRQIFDVSTEHVDALRACDFHIQAVLFCYVALHSNASRELGPGPCESLGLALTICRSFWGVISPPGMRGTTE